MTISKNAAISRRTFALISASAMALTLLASSSVSRGEEDAGFVDSLTAASSPKPAQLVESGDVFGDFLTYMNNTSFRFKIEVPWIERGPKESDSDALARVEALLRDRFVKESNNKIEPSWVYSESIDFERRTVCDQSVTSLASSRREKIESRSANGYSGVQAESSAGAESYRNSYADPYSRTTERGSSSSSLSSLNGESFRVSGYTVVDITDKTYVQTCTKRHVEFRGILQAERVLTSSSAHPRVKLFITFRAIDAMTREFEQRRTNFVNRLQYVLTEPRVRQEEITTMGFVNGAAFVNGMKKDLIELTTDYKTILDIKGMFERGGYPTFAKFIQTQADKMRLNLLSIASTLQPYGAVVTSENRRRKNDAPPSVGTEIIIGVTNGYKVTPLELLNVDELKNSFAGIIDFQFKGLKPSPYLASIESAKEAEADLRKPLEDCRQFVKELHQRHVSGNSIANTFASFRPYIGKVSECTTRVRVAWSSESEVSSQMSGKVCIPNLSTDYYDKWMLFGYVRIWKYSGDLYCL